jgi:hypothetical protein
MSELEGFAGDGELDAMSLLQRGTPRRSEQRVGKIPTLGRRQRVQLNSPLARRIQRAELALHEHSLMKR